MFGTFVVVMRRRESSLDSQFPVGQRILEGLNVYSPESFIVLTPFSLFPFVLLQVRHRLTSHFPPHRLDDCFETLTQEWTFEVYGQVVTLGLM